MGVPLGNWRLQHVLILGLCLCVATVCGESIRLSDLFPFGPGEGDETVPSGNDDAVTVPLDVPIMFYGEPRQSIEVHTDGVLELIGQSSSAFVYVYSADADTRTLGSVFYRETTSEQLLEISSSLYSGFFHPTNFTSMFIATWFYVGYFDGGVDLTNIFQCVIATNGDMTAVFFLYPEDLIEWTTGDNDRGTGGLGGDPADVGFIAPEAISSNSFFLPLSNTSDVVDIESSSNVLIEGLWIFRADNETLMFPKLLETVSESGSCAGSGDGVDAGRCESAGFTTCCTGDSCGLVSPGMPNCSCDAQCFEAGDCCSDVVAIGCHPGITVSFEASSTAFGESETPTNLVINTVVGEIAQNLSFFTPPISSSFILVYSHNGTAQAPADFSDILEVIPLSLECQNITIPVSIVDDLALENTEDFSVNITSTDEFVAIGQDTTQVFIVDNEIISIGLDEPAYQVNESSGFLQVCVQVLEENITLDRPVSVNITTLAVTATDPEDFLGLNDILILAVGESEVCINITINPDNVFELLDQTFAVCIGSDDPAVVTVFAKSLVNITDNTNITIGFLEQSYTGVEADESVTLQVGVSGILGHPLTALVAFNSDTADVLLDFVPVQFVSFEEGVNPIGNLTVPLIFDGVVEFSEFFTVTLVPQFPNVLLDPPMTNVTILDSTEVDVAVDIAEYMVEETAGFFTACLRISGATLARPVSVAVMTENGSAVAPDDYIALSMVDITFEPSGPTVECVNITIVMEVIIEVMETFSFVISPNQTDRAVNIIAPNSSTIIIVDQADVKTVVVDELLYEVDEAAGFVTVCVSMSGGILDRPLSVSVFTENGIAIEPGDYIALSMVNITFVPAGPLVECVNITIIRDFLVEDAELFVFTISPNQADPAVQVGAPNAAFVVILDEPDVLTAVVTDPFIFVNEEVGFATPCVAISGADLARPVSVPVFTEGSTALAPDDYTALPVMDITFEISGPTVVCVNVTIIRDFLVEEDIESFFFVISPNQTDAAVQLSPPFDQSSIIIVDEPNVLTAVVDQTSYEVEEAAGFLTVCVNISGAALDRQVNVAVMTICGTAMDEIFDINPPSPDELDCILAELIARFAEFGTACDSGELGNDTILCNGGECLDFLIDVQGTCNSTLFSDGCAALPGVSDNDYFALMMENIAFEPSGPLMECVNITIVRDFLVEFDEMFSFAVSPNQLDAAVQVGSPNISSVTILDEDELLTAVVAQSSYEVEETDGFITVCVSISGGTLARPVNVAVMTEDDCAEAPDDYASLSMVNITFVPSGPLTECVNISIVRDFLVEPDEPFFFSISLDQADEALQVGSPSTATITILDEDDVLTAVVVQAPNEVEEVTGSITVCVSISGATLNRTVNVAVMTEDGTAIASQDYVAVSMVDIIFEPTGPLTECVDIGVDRDFLVEFDETFSFSISPDQDDPAVQVGLPDTLGITILDEDGALTAVVEQSTYEVPEAGGSVTVCVSISVALLARTVSVAVMTQNGNAIAPADYTAIPMADILFNPSGLTVECIDIDINPDERVEFMETFSFSISPIQDDEAVQVGSPDTATITIIDDDVREAMVEEFLYFVEEIQEFITVCVRIYIGDLDRPVRVSVSTQDVTAMASGDYTALPMTDLIFGPAGPGPLLQCVNITIERDFVVEGDEVFLFSISPTQADVAIEVGAPSASPVTIIDEPSATRTAVVDQLSYSFSETAGFVQVCVSISAGNLGRPLSVTVATSPDTATSPEDYMALPPMTNIIFDPAGPLVECVDIFIVRDLLVENDEQFFFLISPTQDDEAVEVGSPSLAPVTIEDEPNVLTVSFLQSPINVFEALAGNNLPVCVMATGDIAPGVQVSVSLSTSPGGSILGAPITPATPVADYSPTPSPSTISFSDGDLMECVTLQIEDDPVNEVQEAFTLTAVALNPQIFLPVGSNTVLINDNDELIFGFSQLRFSVDEPGPAMLVCINLSSGVVGIGGVSIEVESTGGTATVGPGMDYIAIDEMVSFPNGTSPGNMDGQQCFSFLPLDDDAVEETEDISLAASFFISRPDHQFSLGGSNAFIDIIDNDLPPLDCTIGFSIPQVNGFPESDPNGADACIILTGTTDVSTFVRVVSGAIGDTATPFDDYTPLDMVVEFLPSELPSVPICVTVPFIDDNVAEFDEFLMLTLSESSCPVITQDTTIVEIMNDDGPLQFGIGFELPAYPVVEGTPPGAGNSVDICVSSFVAMPVGVSVTVITTTGSADNGIDFTGFPLVINIPQGMTQGCGPVSSIPDAIVEGNEFVGLSLLAIVPIDSARFAATLLIQEDEVVSVTFSAITNVVSENAGTVMDNFCVVVGFSGTLQSSLSVFVTSTEISALETVNFLEVSETLTFFAPGTQCVPVTIVDDNIPNEPDVTFQLELLVDSFPSITDALIITIADDPGDGVVRVEFVDDAVTLLENSPPTLVCFRALDPFPGSKLFQVTSRSGTALAGSDFVPIDTLLPLTEDQPQCVTVTLMDDSIPEPTEAFFIDLDTDLPLVELLDSSATITILDNDAPEPLGVVFDPAFRTVPEGFVDVEVCIEVSGTILEPFSVTVVIDETSSTATLGVDFTADPVSVFNFSPSDTVLRQCVTLSILDDTVNGADEIIVLSITEPAAFAASATVVINDNDGLDDFLRLIDQTPSVEQMISPTSAEIRTRFVVGSSVASVICELQGDQNIAAFPCGSREEVIFPGLNPDSSTPFTVTLTALDASNTPLEVIERRVRLGLNSDCSTVFVNGDENVVQFIGEMVIIEFITVGPVERTECRLTVNGVDGVFFDCVSPFVVTLDPGVYNLRIRPSGPNCLSDNTIRRNQAFEVVSA